MDSVSGKGGEGGQCLIRGLVFVRGTRCLALWFARYVSHLYTQYL